jgi:RNA polymerase sigma-70 factor (ECF subfamily)
MESVINVQEVTGDIAAGNTARFEELYTHLVDRVFSFVALRTSGRSEALDVTQDTFVELYKALRTFRFEHDAAFYSFVFTIARRQLAQHYAKQTKHKTEVLLEETVGGNEVPAELTHEVQRALETLDDRSREIVVLHHFARYTFAEIATLINMTESAVRVRHHRARTRLADALTH